MGNCPDVRQALHGGLLGGTTAPLWQWGQH